jgi:hypothetical protein
MAFRLDRLLTGSFYRFQSSEEIWFAYLASLNGSEK